MSGDDKKAVKRSQLAMRRRIKAAVVTSEATTRTLVEALTLVEGSNAEALVEAVKALRTIANSGESLPSYARGIARSALRRIGEPLNPDRHARRTRRAARKA